MQISRVRSSLETCGYDLRRSSVCHQVPCSQQAERVQLVEAGGYAGAVHATTRDGSQTLGIDCVTSVEALPDGEIDLVLHHEKPIGVELPNFVILEVAETDPPSKGGHLKPATLETGAVIQVPSFIERGDKLRIDTRDRSYASRA